MDMNFILASIGVFLVTILVLVVILLVAKKFLVASGNVKLTINGENQLEVESGSTLLNTLAVNGVFLPSACGGKGSCGQCKCQVVEGGGEILPSEVSHFSRKQQKDHWRLGCQVKVKGDLSIKVPESVMGVKEYECTVISNKNVATFIKEFKVQLPKGAHMDFIPGSYAQIKIPKFEMDYNKDIDKDLIGAEYLPAWEKFGLFGLKCKNTEETIRAYSMANYPAEGDRIMLTVRMVLGPGAGTAIYTNVMQHRQQHYVTRFAHDMDQLNTEVAASYNQTVQGMMYQGKSEKEAHNMAALSTKGRVQVQATLAAVKEMSGWTFYGCIACAVLMLVIPWRKRKLDLQT